MKHFLLFLILFNIQSIALSFNDNDSLSGFTLFPYGLSFMPMKANVPEPRIGLFKFTGSEEMRVEIGNAVDVLSYRTSHGSMDYRIGIDFFAYALTTGAQGLRLQIDAVDGFFGGHISCKEILDEQSNVSARLRILHRSAHLVDGHYSTASHTWIDGLEPIPYTQDFGELTLAYTSEQSSIASRFYGGFGYATLVRPLDIKRFSSHAGAELSTPALLPGMLNQPLNVFFSYHLSLTGQPVYLATHQVQAGVKIGNWLEKGLTIYAGYYNGVHTFGEYYHQRLETLGIGFSVDFF